MRNMVFIFILLAAGFFLRLLGEFRQRDPVGRSWLFSVPDSLAESLTSFVIYVSLPALILARIPDLQFAGDVLIPVILPWIMLGASALMVLAVCRISGWTGRTKALLLLLVPLGNTSFLGIPMVETFFGEAGVQFALLYDQLGSFLSLAVYGSFIVAYYGTGEEERKAHPAFGTVSRGIIAFPPFLALLAAFVLRATGIPDPARGVFRILGDTLVPLVMVAVGFKIRLRMDHRHLAPFGAGLAVKMAVAPLLALALCRLARVDGLAADVSVFEAGMPPMIAAWALAMKADFEPELGAGMVGFGILFSFVSLNILFRLL